MVEKAFILINENHESGEYGWVFIKEPHYKEESLAVEVNEFVAWDRGAKPEAILKKDLVEMPIEKYREWEISNSNGFNTESIIKEVIDAYKVGEALQ